MTVTKNVLSFYLLASESQHADPNFVTLVAVSSFLFAFVIVVLVALKHPSLFCSWPTDDKRSIFFSTQQIKQEAVKRIIVFFAVVAVPFGAILYANVRIIKNDRADEQEMIAYSRERAMEESVDPIVAAKLKECVKFNSPPPAYARASLTDWCSHQLETGIYSSYRNLIIRCFSGIGLDAEKLKPGSAGIDTCLNETDDYWNSFAQTYSTFLASDSCSNIAASNSNFTFLMQFCPTIYTSFYTSDPGTSTWECDGTDSCYEQDTSSDVTEEDIQASLDDGPCYGDCTDMDNDGRTWDDVDADGDGRYEP